MNASQIDERTDLGTSESLRQASGWPKLAAKEIFTYRGKILNLPDSNRENVPDSVLQGMSVVAFALAKLAGARSSDTANHIWRIQQYLKSLARHLQEHPRFAPILTESYIDLLFFSAPLHNLGTIGIPDWILLKPSRLSSAELAVMKTHTTLARDVIEQIEKTYGYKGEPFTTLKEMAHSHHERWDGGGYPQGLSEEQIPLAARLLAIADVYEGLISNRVYKVGVPHDQAVAIIFQGRGSHFDPDIVDAFIEIQDEFRAIALSYADTDQDMQRMIEYMANAIAEEAQLPTD